jgi:hypothetical protein
VSEAIQAVPPGELRLPPTRPTGADPWKLHQQIRLFGASTTRMPPILVYQDPDGLMEITDGATRATRTAKLAPASLSP